MWRFSHFSSQWWASVMALLSTNLLWSQLRSYMVCPVGQLDPVTLFLTPSANSGVSTALEIIQMFSVHVQSLTHDSEVAQGLQHGGEQLVSSSPGVAFPSTHHVCIVCYGSSGSVMSSFLPLPATLLFRECPVRSHHFLVLTLCPVLLVRHQPILSVPQRALQFHRNQPILSVLQRTLLLQLHQIQPILSVLLIQQFPKCLVWRLLLPTRLWLCSPAPSALWWW